MTTPSNHLSKLKEKGWSFFVVARPPDGAPDIFESVEGPMKSVNLIEAALDLEYTLREEQNGLAD